MSYAEVVKRWEKLADSSVPCRLLKINNQRNKIDRDWRCEKSVENVSRQPVPRLSFQSRQWFPSIGGAWLPDISRWFRTVFILCTTISLYQSQEKSRWSDLYRLDKVMREGNGTTVHPCRKKCLAATTKTVAAGVLWSRPTSSWVLLMASNKTSDCLFVSRAARRPSSYKFTIVCNYHTYYLILTILYRSCLCEFVIFFLHIP